MGAALPAGLIAGAIIGAAEWFAVRQWVSWLWIAATSEGMAVGRPRGAALADYGIDRGDIVLLGAVTGVGVGALQALLFVRRPQLLDQGVEAVDAVHEGSPIRNRQQVAGGSERADDRQLGRVGGCWSGAPVRG